MKKFLKILLVLIILGGGAAEVVPYFVKGQWGHVLYQVWVESMEINTAIDEPVTFYVRSGSNLNDVADALEADGIIMDKGAFLVVSDQMNYKLDKVVPGKYTISPGLTNKELITHLRGGYGAETVNVTFNNIRYLEDLAGKACATIEADSADFLAWLTDPDSIGGYGFTHETVMCMFIPNTYEFYWNTSVQDLVVRMAAEYKAFWTQERIDRANAIGLTQSQVGTLASIVQEESNKSDERPTIAGVYINRVRNGWLLQADPTLKFAIGDWSIQRVLDKHKLIESPYNTYKYAGIPPGPISMPSVDAMEAVLNHEEHDYFYFCAKADFSGYHAFASTLAEHNRNAYAFHQAMNERGIY